MATDVFDAKQLTSIERAAERVAEALGAKKEKDRLIVARAVFDIAADANVFDTAELIEMARERLTPRQGWRFP